MYRRFLVVLGCVASVSVAAAQSQQRRATMRADGNNGNGRGKCTIEVVVDGVADIEISGDSAAIHNQSGQQPQWRRFECTSRMPVNPVNFRFSGVDGRGRQQLIRDPRNGGVAVVRIEDKDNGSEAYTFDLTWDGGATGNYSGSPNDPFQGRQPNNTPNERRDGYRGFGTDQTVRACQDAVRQQAGERFNNSRMEFQATTLDDQSGRRDRVVGSFDVPGRGQTESYRFSCSVSGDGRIQSAEIESRQDPRNAYGTSNRTTMYSSRRVQTCERAVTERFQRDGYSNVDIESISGDVGQGNSDRVVGIARANHGNQASSFNFSCSIDNSNMTVRSIDLQRR